jgi:cbb3-type cytochrome oxidase subunit 3|tara:strand:- start:191 stop:484 length:294 start_codon:yes stop_codon:yes gene_type:complete
MSQKILKFIVIFLGILIVICFLALVYGLYIKTTKKQSNLETNLIDYNLNLEKGHKITDIDMIDNNRILFTIKNNDKVYALIYDIETSNITKIDTSNE